MCKHKNIELGKMWVSNEEFIKRFVSRIQGLLNLDDKVATECAEAALEMWDRENTPEESADSEASYWDGD
jgi:hypothetical protein